VNSDGSSLPASGWFKSSFCQNSACVEVSRQGDFIAIRASQNPADTLRYTTDEWAAFVNALRVGEFDHLLG
jgi:hypothetical protein